MKNLFIIDGAAGTGKTDLIKYIAEKYSTLNTSFIKKYTTRKKRPEEEKYDLQLDLIHETVTEFKQRCNDNDFYTYKYGDEYYGFYRKDLTGALLKSNNVFLILRNKPLIDFIIKEFPEIRTIITYIYSDKENVIKRLKKENYDLDSIKFRLGRINTAWDDYLRHNNAYQEVLINNSNVIDFQKLIDWLISKYNNEDAHWLEIDNLHKYPLVKPLIGFKEKIVKQIARYPFDKNVFLMMKFRETNRRVYRFIEEKLQEKGFHCVRADHEDWNLTDNVFNPIAVLYCCKFGVALFDEPEDGNNFSPNVAYELGIMHQQLKDCLILRHNSLPQMPFDLIKDLHRQYKDNLEIEPIVKSWITSISK
jgi:guanylate kinase